MFFFFNDVIKVFIIHKSINQTSNYGTTDSRFLRRYDLLSVIWQCSGGQGVPFCCSKSAAGIYWDEGGKWYMPYNGTIQSKKKMSLDLLLMVRVTIPSSLGIWLTWPQGQLKSLITKRRPLPWYAFFNKCFLFPEFPMCQRLFLDQREKTCVRFCPSPNPWAEFPVPPFSQRPHQVSPRKSLCSLDSATHN